MKKTILAAIIGVIALVLPANGQGSCIAPPTGLVSWWRGEGNASDATGSNHGTAQSGVGFAAGKAGQAFLLGVTNNGVRIPASAALNVGTGGGMTIECWVNLATVTGNNPLIEWNDGDEATGGFWGVHLFVGSFGAGSLYANVVGPGETWHQLNSAAGVVNSNVFQHVALTYDKASGVARIFCNGAVVAEQSIGSFTPLTDTDLYIGKRPAGAGAFNSKGLMDEVSLYNRALTTNEIMAIYQADNSGKCVPALPPPPIGVPQITGFTPALGTNGTVVTLIGTNFSPVAASNIVYFGAVRAAVTAASPTSMTVVVPSGATYAPPSVTVAGLIGYARSSFLPTYPGGAPIGSNTFAAKFDLTANTIQIGIAFGDLDGDGHPDIVVANATGSSPGSSLSVYRNLGLGGAMTSASFAPKVDFALGTFPYSTIVADIDGDGKLDIIASNNGNGGSNTVSVLRNISSPGSITAGSFAARVNFITGSGPVRVAADDLDKDGKTDLVVATFQGGGVSVLRNTGQAGVINSNTFAPKVDFATGAGVWEVQVGDIDMDGKPEIVTANYTARTVSVLRNQSTPGSLTVNSFAPRVNFPVGDSYAVAIGDLNGDGKAELTVANFSSNNVSVFRNVSTPGSFASNSFAPPVLFATGSGPHGVAIGDVDGDGRPDLAISAYNISKASLLRNMGAPGSIINSNSFAAKVDFTCSANPQMVALADLNGDGRPDLATTSWGGSLFSVMQNITPPSAPQLPPVITQQPVGHTIPLGDSVTFSVTATGAQPFSYQWLLGGIAVNGATNRLLTLPDAQLSQAGNYSVIVGNAFGNTPSSNALLTVVIPDCTTAPSGLVAWWPGNNDSFDSVGTNHGTVQSGVGFATGKVGQAFLLGVTNNGVRIPASAALNVGTGGGMTFECWVNLATVTGNNPLIEWNDGDEATGGFWGVHLFVGSFGAGSLYANVVGPGETWHQINSPAGVVKSNVFQHVALTYDRASGLARIFCNGAIVAQQSIGSFTPLTDTDLYLGKRPAGSGVFNSIGLMDEASLYNRALTTNEIAAIYAARGTGKCPLSPTVLSVTPPSWNVNEGQTVSFSAVATGTAPLSYQWLHGGNPISGATTSSLVLSNVLFAQAGNYSVLVSNIAGTATSSNVVLDVNRAPVADASATDALVVAPLNCDGVSLASVVLDGSNSSDPDADGLTYSWFQHGVSNAIATGVVAVVQLPAGSNHLTLVVSDGMASSSQSFVVEVITTDTAVERLMAVVQANADRPQPLIASLRAALASIDRCQPEVAINHLEAFKNKVLAQVAPNDPDLANLLLGEAQALIDILNGGAAPAAALEITEISQGNNGKPHLKIRGASGRVHIIETSVDMVNWVKIGVAGCNGGCDYEFNDAQTPDAGARFYRVVSPR